MESLVIESWQLLFYVDCLMRFRNFRRLHERVRQEEVRRFANANTSDKELCHALDVACVLYFKRVLCLQRSAATAILLRRYGWRAEMVLGAQMLPFLSHAWVEIDGRVANDKPYVTEVFQVLERC